MGRAFKPSPFGVANNLGGGISFCSSDQFYKIFGGAPHLKEDHAEFAVLTRHSSKNGFFADGGQHNGALIAFDVNLIQTAAAAAHAPAGRDAWRLRPYA